MNTNYILSPHFDDAVFSLGGLIAKEAQNSKVITVFGGKPPTPLSRSWDRACGFKNSTVAIETRSQENVAALTFLGVTEGNIINLSYLDKQYRDTHSDHANQNLIQKIADDIRSILSKDTSNEIKIFVPMMRSHVDHALVHDAALSLVSDQKIQIYEYQDVPYVYDSWVHKRICRFFTSKEKILLSISPQNSPITKEHIPLSAIEYEKKIAASKLYASQFKLPVIGLRSVFRKQKIFAILQAKLYATPTPFCEVVYRHIS